MNIYYVHLERPTYGQLHRDCGKRFSDSLGFTFVEMHEWTRITPTVKDVVIMMPPPEGIDDRKWTDFEMFKVAYSHFKRCTPFTYVRLVDNNPALFTEYDMYLRDFIKSNGVKVITPYSINYLHDIVPYKVIPFHYEHSEQVNLRVQDREDKVVFAGYSDDLQTQPYKTTIETLMHKDDPIVQLELPEYNIGCPEETDHLNQEFREELAKHKIILVSSGDGKEVLRYVESAECGCVPVGEFCPSVLKVLPEGLKFLHHPYPNEFIHWLRWNLNELIDYAPEISDWWRQTMKLYRSKETIIRQYEKLNRL